MHLAKHFRIFLPVLLAFFCQSQTLVAQELAVEAGTIHTITGESYSPGIMLVKDGKIQDVGDASSINVPSNWQKLSFPNSEILPGLVDTHSHVGSVEGGDSSAPLHPDVRVLDAVNVMNDNIWKARSGGITTVNIMSGSGHLMSGQTLYLKTKHGKTIHDLMFCKDPLTDICGGMKMANGTNSKRGGGKFPGTRARSASLARNLFLGAVEYKKKIDAGKDVERDLKKEALIEVMDGRRIVHFHTHRHDDILTALRIGKEFGFTPVLHHVSEGWKVADQIAAAGAPASIIYIDSPGGKLEAVDLLPTTGKIMSEAGVDVAFHTDDSVLDSRLFLRNGALAVRAGMDRQKALEALTIAGARMLQMDDRLGSLEKGKDADFVVLSGDPFSIYTMVEKTFIEGEIVYDSSDPEQRKFATGGFRAFKDAASHFHGVIEGEWNEN